MSEPYVDSEMEMCKVDGKIQNVIHVISELSDGNIFNQSVDNAMRNSTLTPENMKLADKLAEELAPKLGDKWLENIE